MEREDAFFYECLLVSGFSGEYKKWLYSCLERESPLSNTTLELSSCESDFNKSIDILHEYRISGPIDESSVCNRLRLFLRQLYHDGLMDKSEIISTMHTIASHMGDPGNFDNKLWNSMWYFEDYFVSAEGGIINLETFDSIFFAYLDNGIPLDSKKMWEPNKKASFFTKIKHFFKK